MARQGPREIYARNISLFLGQEVIAHRWNLQWEPNGAAPPRRPAKAPFTLYSNIMSAPQALLAGCFFFFLDRFHFFTEDCPAFWPLGTGVSLDLAGERKKYTVAY